MADNFYASYGSGGGGSGTVTEVDTGTGLTGGPITTTGTIALANTAVTPGSYTSANITVDQQGRITLASNGGTGDVSLTAVGSSPNANAATLTGQVLNLQPANGTNPGVITSGTQTLGGNKTFTGTISASNLSGTNTGDVTLSTANGLSLVSQALSLQAADASHTGALTSTDWSTFNSKQAAGNYITALTGDATASGPGSAALTLATVNSNVGSFGGATSVGIFTVNAKGLVTAAASTSIQIAESQVTNLVSDLAGKQAIPSPVQGAIAYSNASNLVLSAAGTTGQALISGGTGAPTWFVPTAGSALFAGTSGILAEDNANFFWDSTNHRLGIGTATPAVNLHIANSTAVSFRLELAQATSTNAPAIVTRRARGSLGSPTAVQNGDTLNFIGTLGYGATGYAATNFSTAIFSFAEENYTDAAQGASISFSTTPNGTIVRKTRVRIKNDGALQLTGDTSGNALSLYADASTANYSLHFPAAQGSNHTTLHNDGSGNLTFSLIDLTTDITGILPLANGGTGVNAASANAAFNALSPLTTKGDLLGFSTVNARLGVGSDAQVLTADTASTLGFKWAANVPGNYTHTAQTTTYSILTTDGFIDCSGSAFTVTLPTAVGVSGKQYTITKTDSSLTNIITIATTSSQTIGSGGGTTTTLNTQGESITIYSNNANWVIEQRRIPCIETNGGAITITSSGGGVVKGTTTTDAFIWWRIGNMCHFRYKFVASGTGTAGTGIYKFTTLTGLTADTTNMTLYTSTTAGDFPEVLGNGQVTAVGASAGSLAMCFFDSTHFRLAGQAQSPSYQAVGGGFYSFSQTIIYALIGSYPVSGWAG